MAKNVNTTSKEKTVNIEDFYKQVRDGIKIFQPVFQEENRAAIFATAAPGSEGTIIDICTTGRASEIVHLLAQALADVYFTTLPEPKRENMDKTIGEFTNMITMEFLAKAAEALLRSEGMIE